MNILVAAMFEGETQNPKIMRILCSEWEKQGHTVVRFFPCSTKMIYERLRNNSNIYPFVLPKMSNYDCILRQLVLNRKSIRTMIKLVLVHPLFFVEFILRRIPIIDDYRGNPGKIKKEIQRACKAKKYDLIVVGSNPFFLALGVSKANVCPRKIWYQMDPHSDNGMIRSKLMKREKKAEAFVFEHMDKVFVQPSSYTSIIKELQERIAKKVFPTRFPLVDPSISAVANRTYFKKDTINCVYAGALMLPIRRPDFMFRLFSLFSNQSIHLYVWCGNLTDDKKKEMTSMMPSNVTYCGSLPQSEMQMVLAGADFLVSLGNTVTNQLPSKLLDYISLRKPIINIYKTDDCPTRHILSGYPLSISISETEDASDAAFRIEQFIQDTLGQQADSTTIEENYHDYLPNVVAEYILNT